MRAGDYFFWGDVGTIIGTGLGKLFGFARDVANADPTEHQPAGTIHLFAEDAYHYSAPQNPFDHESLRWETDELGVVMWDKLSGYTNYYPAIIGAIQVHYPPEDAGRIAVLLDNRKVAALGLGKVDMSTGALWVAERRKQNPNFCPN